MSCGDRDKHMNDEVIGYCKYCLEEIYDMGAYVMVNEDKYHVDCYDLVHREFDPYLYDEE